MAELAVREGLQKLHRTFPQQAPTDPPNEFAQVKAVVDHLEGIQFLFAPNHDQAGTERWVEDILWFVMSPDPEMKKYIRLQRKYNHLACYGWIEKHRRVFHRVLHTVLSSHPELLLRLRTTVTNLSMSASDQASREHWQGLLDNFLCDEPSWC